MDRFAGGSVVFHFIGCVFNSLLNSAKECWKIFLFNSLLNKLSNVLCDSRKMDSHFMELLTSGSPTEIRVKDGSWLTEEEFSKIMKGCDTSTLTVLQLDLCGHCLPDYVLRPVLAQSPNSLPALSSISLRGACRLTDGGIKALVASAPSLCSVNLAAS